jgi:ribosomal subunit interface protein
MQLTVTGKQADIGNALREHVETSLEAILTKYFKTAIESHVVIAKEAYLIRAEISLHIGRGIVVNAGAALSDPYAAFDSAAERIAKQMRRYKRRLRDHHAQLREPTEPSRALATLCWRQLRRMRVPIRRSKTRIRSERRLSSLRAAPSCRG